MTKLYNVHLYREMLLYFPDVAAESPQQAAETCKDRCSDDASRAPDDCDGETFGALVDVQGDSDYSQSVMVDFEAERYRKSGEAAILLLDMLRHGVLSLADGDAEFQGTVYAFDAEAPDWQALVNSIGYEAARDAIAQRTGTPV